MDGMKIQPVTEDLAGKTASGSARPLEGTLVEVYR